MIYTAIVFLPLVGALIAGLFGRALGDRPSELVTSTLLVIAAILSWIVFLDVGFNGTTAKVALLRWVTSGDLAVSWGIRVDTLTGVMLVVVNTVSALVHIYSMGYMHDDPHRPRFFAYLSLFTFAMLMLVTADNLLQMFFGWEGVGLASYLLIGFWYQKPSANAAAMKAFIVNRVGDFGYALGIFGVFAVFGSIQFDTVFAAAPAMAHKPMHFLNWDLDTMTVLCLLLFMGAMGKSAQFLLHTWLPDAMEGPTPVSALIHAATMVTAGVFMVARLSPLFEQAPDALVFVTAIGAITAFFAATVGLVQNDIKRVIAYSTCSQLGYMFVACGVGAYSAGIFHLFTHAFFKALLFLGAGSVIHAMHHEQDMRHMGGLARKIPITWAMMLVGTLALTGVGIPGLGGFAGFHSKDAIIEASYAAHSAVARYAFWSLTIAAFMTSFYSWRLMFMTFYGPVNSGPAVAEHATPVVSGHDGGHHGDAHEPHESPYVMLVPLFVLATGAVLAGIVFQGWFIGNGAHGAEASHAFWRSALFTGPDNHILHDMHDVPAWVSFAPTLAMVAGFALSWLYYVRAPWLPGWTARNFSPLYQFLLNKWYFDELYDRIFVRPSLWIGRTLWKVGDGRLIDGLGPDGIAARVLDTTRGVLKLQTGYVYHYAFTMMIGVAAVLTWFMFGGFTFGGLVREMILGGQLLSVVTFLPLAGALWILLFLDRDAKQNARYIALWTTLITFMVSLLIWWYFDPATAKFQFVEEREWLGGNIKYKMGVDGISMLFVILTTFLMPLCILASWESIETRVLEYMVAFLVLESLMIGVFCALDLVLFYLFFEAGLIPMFLIIGVWGGKRRVYASFKFFLYTLLGSVLMLLAMMAMYGFAGTTDIPTLLATKFPPAMQTWLWLAFFASFAVKMPMWPVHTWLPDAHVEAPTAGSVILAGILLKMGGYGFLRFSIPMFPIASHELATFVFVLSVVAIIYTSLVALAQEDIKKLIAYSSVAHMGFVTMGLFALNAQGIQGGIFQMLSHGIVSAALFLCVGIVYDRMHTREIAAYGGLVNRMPLYAACFMVFTMANVGLPGTSGFVGEFLTLLGAFKANTWVAFLATSGVILSAAYALWLYRRVIFGVLDKASLKAITDINVREIVIIAPLVALTLLFGIFPAPLLDPTAVSVRKLVADYDRALADHGLADTAKLATNAR